MSTNFPAALDADSSLWVQVNGINTTLNGLHDSVVVTFNVLDTTSFPSAGYFVVDTEVVKYTGKTGTSFTGCTRGADGSTAASHSSGVTVNAYAVAAHHNDVKDAVIAIETLLGNSSQNLDLSARAGLGVKLKSSGGNSFILTVDDSGNLTIASA